MPHGVTGPLRSRARTSSLDWGAAALSLRGRRNRGSGAARALIIKGPGGTRREKVGAKLTLKAQGVCRITMVKQAPDDNHLKLTIK
jgi:hypothetical protein